MTSSHLCAAAAAASSAGAFCPGTAHVQEPNSRAPQHGRGGRGPRVHAAPRAGRPPRRGAGWRLFLLRGRSSLPARGAQRSGRSRDRQLPHHASAQKGPQLVGGTGGASLLRLCQPRPSRLDSTQASAVSDPVVYRSPSHGTVARFVRSRHFPLAHRVALCPLCIPLLNN